jgi:ATP-dependent Clp protease ATP-binding subunit ClpA
MFERFSSQARTVIRGAEAEAVRSGSPLIGTQHLLLSMLSLDRTLAYAVLTAHGLTYDGVSKKINALVGPGELGPEDAAALSAIGIDLDTVRARMAASFGDYALDSLPGGRRRYAPRTKKVIELGLRESLRLKQRHVGTEHLLLGLIREGEGLAAKVIVDSGVSLSTLRDTIVAEINRAA